MPGVFTFALFLLIGLPGSLRAGDRSVAFQLQVFPFRDQSHTVIVIKSYERSPGDPDPEPAKSIVARKIIKQFHQWKFKKYQEEYPEVAPRVLERMRREGEQTDNLVGLVLIVKGHDPRKVEGSIAFYDGETLPSEAMFGVKFPRPPIRMYSGEAPVLGLWDHWNQRFWDRGGYYSVVKGKKVHRRGGTVEVASLFNQGKEDYLPFLFSIAEWEEISSRWKQRERKDAEGVYHHDTYYSQLYVMSTAERNAEWFAERWGARPIGNWGTIDGSRFFQLNREEYVNIGNHYLSKRPGILALQDSLQNGFNLGRFRPGISASELENYFYHDPRDCNHALEGLVADEFRSSKLFDP